MASDIGKMHFRRVVAGTDADFAVLARVHEDNIRKLPDLLIGLLANLKADEAYPIDPGRASRPRPVRCATGATRSTGCARSSTISGSQPPFDRTAECGALYDEVSFDPAYPSEPISTFEPMVRRVLHKDWTPPT